MSFLQPWMLVGLPLILIPIIIHLINQWRYQTKRWGAMMFLLSANRMNRGYARLRQWLILATRMLVIAGLLLAASRPLASGLLGMTGGGKVDTTLVLLDRSPSMQQLGSANQSKLSSGRRQLHSALGTLGQSQWTLIESNHLQPQAYPTLDALLDAPMTGASSATANIPQMLSVVADYLSTNKPGPTDVWICSDLRSSDWMPGSSSWNSVRQSIGAYPNTVKFRLLAYPDRSEDNLAIRVTNIRRDDQSDENALLVSLEIFDPSLASGSRATLASRPIPVQIEVDGARTESTFELTGRELQIRNYRVPLATQQTRGWGKLSLPADSNAADNVAYFVYDDHHVRRAVLVSDEPLISRPLEIAASISPAGEAATQVEQMTPAQIDSAALENTALVIWSAPLPEDATAAAVKRYVQAGGQVLFFPPKDVVEGLAGTAPATTPEPSTRRAAPKDSTTETASQLAGQTSQPQGFMGVRWKSWVASSAEGSSVYRVSNWRGDQDLLAATQSGAGLPVGQIELRGHALLEGENVALATFEDNSPLLAKVTTDHGGVYFCTASPHPDQSNLAADGVVLYVLIQRALEKGLQALSLASQRVAGSISSNSPSNSSASSMASNTASNIASSAANRATQSDDWKRVSTSTAAADNEPAEMSSEYPWRAGVYEHDGQLFAINRSPSEDNSDLLDDKQLEELFAGLNFSRVEEQAGSLSSIVREIWQLFLLAMIAAMIIEAWLCLPRVKPIGASTAGFRQAFVSRAGDERKGDLVTMK